MNKTVYLRDDDVPVWERAKELAGDKLSLIIVANLRRYISEKESDVTEYKRILLEYPDGDNHNLPTKKAFHGRWIFDEEKPLILHLDGSEDEHHYSIAETAKGNVVVFTHIEDRDSRWGYRFLVYSSFDKAAANTDINFAIRRALEHRGIPVQELDI